MTNLYADDKDYLVMNLNMKVLINYADQNFYKSQKKNSETGLTVGGFDKVIEYGPKDIDLNFYKENREILESSRGGGYWLWKPYFIEKTLQNIDYGDYLFYCDSGAEFINSIEHIIKLSKRSKQVLIPFRLTHLEKHYTKRDAFVLMNCDYPRYVNTCQRMATFIFMKKSEYALKFVGEYLQYAQDKRIITDIKNTMGFPNYPGFRRHRHDQSIFSLLSKKHGLSAFRDPSQWGNNKNEYPNAEFEQILLLTRDSDMSFVKKIYLKFKHKLIDLKRRGYHCT